MRFILRSFKLLFCVVFQNDTNVFLNHSHVTIDCFQSFLWGVQLSGNYFRPLHKSNITPHETGIGSWTLDDFVTAMQTGVNPDGHELRPPMPWQAFVQMTPEELEALYLYFQSIEPVDNEIAIE